MITIKRITALWCMSCLVMKKTWDKVFENFPDFKIIDYDFDEDNKIVEMLQIGDILPVLIVYKNNQEITRIIGEKSKRQLYEILIELTK